MFNINQQIDVSALVYYVFYYRQNRYIHFRNPPRHSLDICRLYYHLHEFAWPRSQLVIIKRFLSVEHNLHICNHKSLYIHFNSESFFFCTHYCPGYLSSCINYSCTRHSTRAAETVDMLSAMRHHVQRIVCMLYITTRRRNIR